MPEGVILSDRPSSRNVSQVRLFRLLDLPLFTWIAHNRGVVLIAGATQLDLGAT